MQTLSVFSRIFELFVEALFGGPIAGDSDGDFGEFLLNIKYFPKIKPHNPKKLEKFLILQIISYDRISMITKVQIITIPTNFCRFSGDLLIQIMEIILP